MNLQKLPRRRRQSGNILLEFSLAAPLLFLFFFGIVNFARLFNSAEVVADAAAAGTQYGALSPAHNGDFTGMQNAALADAPNAPGLTATASQFCTCSIGGPHLPCPASCNNGSSQTYIEVDASLPFTATLTFPGMPTTMTLTHNSIVRVQ